MVPQLEFKVHQRGKQLHKHHPSETRREGNLTLAILFHRMLKKQRQGSPQRSKQVREPAGSRVEVNDLSCASPTDCCDKYGIFQYVN